MAEIVIQRAPYIKDNRRSIKLVCLTGKDSRYTNNEYFIGGPIGGWIGYGSNKDQAIEAFNHYTR